jgi:hypothetical protein
MIKKLATIASLLCASVLPTNANILEFDTVAGLTSYLANVNDQSTLVIFDIDMVLLISHESYFRIPTLRKYLDIYKAMTKSLTEAEKDVLLIYMLMDAHLVPLDLKMVELVQSFQRRGIPTIAFTASLTGSLDRIANIAAWRMFTLEFAGYHFESSFPHLTHSVVFEQFPKYIGSYPLFNRGVLFANGGRHDNARKGKVLVQFLKYVYQSHNSGLQVPKRIFMIEGRKENLEDIKASLREFFPEIVFTGIHLTAAEYAPISAISEAEFKNKMEEIVKLTQLNQELHLKN